MLDQKVGLQGVGMIVIDLFSLLEGDPVVASVIVVMIDHRHLVTEGLLDPSGKGGFAAAGAAGYADDDAFMLLILFLFIYFKDPVIHLSFLPLICDVKQGALSIL